MTKRPLSGPRRRPVDDRVGRKADGAPALAMSSAKIPEPLSG